MSKPQPTSTRNRQKHPTRTDILEDNGHSLVVVDEWLPGNEPTDYDIELTDGPEYLTRYWRCRHCGQERNQRSEFEEPCEGEPRPHPLGDGGYSIEDPRTRRALTEEMDVRFGSIGSVYEVASSSGNDYEVDVVAETCSCPDFQKRTPENGCKHLRRVDLAVRLGLVPQPDGTFSRLSHR